MEEGRGKGRWIAFADRHAGVLLWGVLILAWAVAAWQGNRVSHIRDAELFYRWVESQATQHRVFSLDLEETPAPDAPKMMDRELFQEIDDVMERVLPDVARATVDVDESGQPLSKLTIWVRDEINDRLIWATASGPALRQQREEFFQYLSDKRLSTIASQFDPSAVYNEGEGSVSISNVFLGFRKLAANLVWLRMDKYWHQGLTHRMLPLLRTCVALDPTFVDAYLLGAWHLAYNFTAHMPDTPEPLKKWSPTYKVRLGDKELYYYLAIDLLKDGIRKNHRNYKLYFDLGFSIYKLKLQDYTNAVRYLSEALRYRHDKWVPRQLYLCLELNGQYEEALAGWEDYLKNNPENLVAPRFILRNKALLKERDAQKALADARATEDPVKARIQREEGEGLYAEARKIWEEMSEPYATARILRMDALKYLDQKRYIEAIALLEHARWESASEWEEATDLIIDAKTKGNIPLSKSEQLRIERKKEIEQYKKLPPPEEQKKA